MSDAGKLFREERKRWAKIRARSNARTAETLTEEMRCGEEEMDSKDERMDIYDVTRHRTGRVVPRNSFLQAGEYMLYVLTLIERPSDGRFLITRRALTKKWAAGAWEVSGGGARAGEDSFTAVTREVREETGLDISDVPAEMRMPIYGYRNEDLKRGDNYFVDIYHVKLEFADEEVTIERSEAIDFRMATMDEIRALHEADEFLHYKRIQEALAAEKSAQQA